MNPLSPDLADCAREPIRTPGAIQPHGWLLVLDGHGRPTVCSDNAPSRAQWETLLTRYEPRLRELRAGEGPTFIGTEAIAGRDWDFSAHATNAGLVVEFEPATAHPAMSAPIYTLARSLLPRLQEARTVDEIATLAAEQMKALTGFGRCLVYRFNAEDHGEVLAETRDEDHESYAGHWFPASDIPSQARQLYVVNQIRLIPDAYYQPVALRALDGRSDPQAIDLGFAALRSVSPVHLEFMRNMGTIASMSVSIVVRGRLWGMISCHDNRARQVSMPTRIACEHLGRLLSLQVAALEDSAEAAARLDLRQLTLQLVAALKDGDASLQNLVQEESLLRLTRASGAAVVLDDRCWRVGDAPPPEQLQALARWVGTQPGEVVHTDRLWEQQALELRPLPAAAGALAISLSQVHRHYVFWFRPEFVRTIKWAGEPRKPDAADGRLHPRLSFASWQEQVRGRSLPWSQAEIAAVQELRQALVEIVLRRAEEMAQLSEELARTNKELEAFSYTVSHDLRAPSRHIAGYVDLVLEDDAAQLGERSRRYLGHVKEAAAVAGRLVDALLDFSRLGRLALHKEEVDTQTMMDELIVEMRLQPDGDRVDWQRPAPMIPIWGDAFLVQAVVRNLLSNAVKYSRTRETPQVRIEPVSTAEGDGLQISDNGVGFDQKYVDKLFNVFQRLHQADEFEGTGIGLANVRRIVERHGGTVWARGTKDRGATFGFIMPRRGEDL